MEKPRDILAVNIQNFEVIPKFALCIPTDNYMKSCCGELFPLRSAIYIFCLLDLTIGAICAVNLVRTYSAGTSMLFPTILLNLANVLMIVPAICSMHGAARSRARKVAYGYYSRLAQVATKFVLRLWETGASCAVDESCGFLHLMGRFLISFLEAAFFIWAAHVFFSYINLVCKGDHVLANNGIDLAQVMSQYRHQAAALEMHPYPDTTLGLPPANPGTQIQMNDTLPEQTKK